LASVMGGLLDLAQALAAGIGEAQGWHAIG
jgi:hypothetical protein